MARFIIADLTGPKSVPHELAHVIQLLPSVPIIPLIVKPQKEYTMFEHFFGFRHVLKPFQYRDEAHLLASFEEKVIAPAEKMAQRVAGKRSRRFAPRGPGITRGHRLGGPYAIPWPGSSRSAPLAQRSRGFGISMRTPDASSM
jgi:hypothetical protein